MARIFKPWFGRDKLPWTGHASSRDEPREQCSHSSVSSFFLGTVARFYSADKVTASVSGSARSSPEFVFRARHTSSFEIRSRVPLHAVTARGSCHLGRENSERRSKSRQLRFVFRARETKERRAFDYADVPSRRVEVVRRGTARSRRHPVGSLGILTRRVKKRSVTIYWQSTLPRNLRKPLGWSRALAVHSQIRRNHRGRDTFGFGRLG